MGKVYIIGIAADVNMSIFDDLDDVEIIDPESYNYVGFEHKKILESENVNFQEFKDYKYADEYERYYFTGRNPYIHHLGRRILPSGARSYDGFTARKSSLIRQNTRPIYR